jgi:hypothetical protein
VEVPLDPPSGLVRGGDDPGPGGGEFGSALGVSDGRGDELGEVGHPLGGVGRKRLASGHHTPQPAVDNDRTRHHRPDLEPPEVLRDRVRQAAPQVIGGPRGPAGAPYHRRGKVIAQFQARADPEGDRVLPETADDHDRGPVQLEAGDAGVLPAQ